ncbi:glycosyl transferase family 1 [Parapedobacter defluvii]|uniref:Glycosyl transferase family 1 n=1 Tax=Parapedobacter defluvii TaxID=2045106 RepID=A0ABQ1N018_9SPHI|nr:glycosyltransferase family 1 protein [Parapedobacter defluvii]RQP08851.1 MAG: glycosyltransferase family 1 protein [Parapedobacter sp.]GGC48057.1 glycosyl transferase family 1 [Parapedobacter defluvii]
MSLRVLIDGRWAGDTGIGKLYREVMERIPAGISPAFIQSNMGLGNLLTPWMLAREIRSSDAEVFYSPSFMPPLRSRIPFVFTIHDLMHLFYYTPWHRLYYQQVIARLAAKAQQIITVSHFSKKQLVELLGIDERLVTVVYNGVDEIYRRNTEAFRSEAPYFLYVGNRRKNKNIPAMLTAFAHAAIPMDFMFFLSGHGDETLCTRIAQLGIEKRVRFLGRIPEAELPKLYKGAYATLFVSLMEGFGLPVIESMASGTPVLTSTAGPLPEVAGDAALCVDPHSVEAIQAGIEALVNDSDGYRDFQQKGTQRSAQFTWDRTAADTWNVIMDKHLKQ